MKKQITLIALSALILLLCNNCGRHITLNYLDKHPEKLADLCASKYPVKTDSVSVDSTRVTAGTQRTETDTLPGEKPPAFTFDCDSAISAAREAGKTDGIFSVDCPPCPPSTKTTVYKTDTVHKWRTTVVTKENTAALAAANAKTEALRDAGIKQGQKLFFYKRCCEWLAIFLAAWFIMRCLRTWLSKFTWLGWLTKLL